MFEDGEQRVALVTGGGRNVGEAIARSFSSIGIRVAVADVHAARAERVSSSINEQHPERAFALVADVTKAAEVDAMVRGVLDRYGRVDILVNNVGIVDRKPILELEEDEWDRVINVSLKSVFLVTRAVGRVMADAGRGGRIINLGSTTGYVAPNNRTAYPAAKAGVLHLTRAVAIQLAPYGIRVSSITPNLVATEVDADEPPRNYPIKNLIGRQCQPQDVANAAVFLISPEAEFITGSDFLVDGGSMIAR
jgi:NAD(P)-dependent dehydrogenase (short-subunit alcohol dehydrogenase family)